MKCNKKIKGLLLRKVTQKSDFLKEAINNTCLICSQTGNAFRKIVTKINCFAIVTYSILDSSFRLLERHPSSIFLVWVLLLASVYENQSKMPVNSFSYRVMPTTAGRRSLPAIQSTDSERHYDNCYYYY